MSVRAQYDGSFCGLCKEKIPKDTVIGNHNDAWCHQECIDAVGSTPQPGIKPGETHGPEQEKPAVPADWQPPTHANIPELSPALKDFVLYEDEMLIQIENVIEAHHKSLGIAYNGQRIGMHAREIYLQARKTNLVKASEIKYKTQLT